MGIKFQEEITEDQSIYMSEDISYDKLRERLNKYSIWWRIYIDLICTFWISSLIIGFFVYPILLAILVLYSKTSLLVIFLYYIWIYYDRDTPHNGGRKIELPAGNRIFCRDYFPVGIIKTAELPPTKNYIFCTFPHALFCMGATINMIHDQRFFSKLYPNLVVYSTTLSSNFYAPITRDLILFQGLVAVSEKGLTTVLTRKPNSGQSVNLIVGGAAEVFVTDPDEYRVILKRRKGFIRIALKTGASLVPTFSFGENQLYSQVKAKWLRVIQEKLYAWTGYALVLVKGRKFFGIYTLMPRVVPLITVFGDAIDVPQIDNPSKEQIDEYHSKFCVALHDLFEKYKKRCDPLGADARISFL